MPRWFVAASCASIGAAVAARRGARRCAGRGDRATAGARGFARSATHSASRAPRTRIRVTPRYPYRNYHSLYPLPYDIEYPGPQRDAPMRRRGCVQEHRPSGTVIVPRMRCWWVRR